MDKKVFMSYSAKDATYADLLARTLKKNGVEVYSSHDPQVSEDMETVLRRELKESSAVISLISDNWAHSNSAATEYGAAYAMGKQIIPVVIDELTNDVFVDFTRFATVDAKNDDLESVAQQVEQALSNNKAVKLP